MQNAYPLASFFSSRGIDAIGVLPISECRITKPYLLQKHPGFLPRSVILFLVPYYAGPTENLSVYAATLDYHLFFKAIGEEFAAKMKEHFPDAAFLTFSDHSPIDEREAAAKCGLGFFGKNGLLIHPTLGSFCFIGEVVCDLPADTFAEAKEPSGIRSCEGCGLCLAACPTGCLSGESDVCLSALTQKKGGFTDEEAKIVKKCGSAWGCDACQTVCPHNQGVIGSGGFAVPFFRENRITKITSEIVENMTDEAFSSRAFGWRGREPLVRNLKILEEEKDGR